MSNDDPRGFRRGPSSRDYPPSRQGHGGQPPAQSGDRYDRYRQPEPASQRPSPPEKPQASFSAYRPEAYAAPERRPAGRNERSEWDDGQRSAAPPPLPPRAPSPAPEPFPRAPHPRDPYFQSAAADPYASPSSQGYDADWRRDPYQGGGGAQHPQHPSYYSSHDDLPSGSDLESVHDRFFAPDPEPERPQPPAAGRYASDYDDRGYGVEDQSPYGDQSAKGYAVEPAQRHHGVHTASTGFGETDDYAWDKYEQPPAPQSLQPYRSPPNQPDDDIDADFFADEDDYDQEEYAEERRSGRKKLMAAVLVGAVVTGGALAYVYKSTTGEGDGEPSLIAADSRPVKEEPAEPGGRDFPNGNKLIYDRLGGDNNSSARLAGGETSSAGDSGVPGIVTTGGTLEERIENALKAQQSDDGPSEREGASSPDSPRTVRTLTFGPDGNPKPVESTTQRIAAAPAPSENVSAGVVVTTEQTAAASRLSSESAETSPEPAPAESRPAQAQPRPAAQVAAVSPAAPAITESASGTGNYFVQIAARNDQEAAMAAFATLQQQYVAVIGNHSPSVRKVDLGEKGVWYRLLVGPVETKSEADELCEKLKGAGMKSCFSRKD